MKITIAWNVWNNYEDVLLGSEILRKRNDETAVFEELKLISQGGYPQAPTSRQKKYLDSTLKIEVDLNNSIVSENSRNIGALRIIAGIKSAFNYANLAKSDFLVITNADGWFLDLGKLKKLLLKTEVQCHCISVRVGKTTAVINNFGDFIPFFDDHFIIINVKRSKALNIFAYDSLKCVTPIFRKFGGFHYMLGCYFEEVLPKDELYPYTDSNRSLNHYGENIAHNLLPWQLQNEFGFLHANCIELPKLHILRASLLRIYKYDRYPEISEYCYKYAENAQVKIKDKVAFFKTSIPLRVMFFLLMLQLDIRQFLLYINLGRKFNKVKFKQDMSGAHSASICFEQRGVYPIGIGSRE